MKDISIVSLAQMIFDKKLKPITPTSMYYFMPNYATTMSGLATGRYVDDITAAQVAASLNGSVIKITPQNVWTPFWIPNTANGTNIPLANYIQLGENGIICARDVSDIAMRSSSIPGLTTLLAIQYQLIAIIPGAKASDELYAWLETPIGQQFNPFPIGPLAPLLFQQ